MGLYGKNRVELAAEVLQGNDRSQLYQLFIRKMSLKLPEEPIRNSLAGITHSLRQLQGHTLPLREERTLTVRSQHRLDLLR